MSTEIARAQTSQPAPTPKQAFARTVAAMAEKELLNLFGSNVGKQAASRVAAAFRAAAATAKDPTAFWACTADSVASCMITSAFTAIMPGGPFPGCWLIPKRRNTAARGKPEVWIWELHWWINHRGIKTLARRAGQSIEALPYFDGDEVVIQRGRNWRVEVVEGPAPDRDDPAAMAGVVYYVSDIETGALLAARKMTKGQIGARRAKSDMVKRNDDGSTVATGPWRDWPLEMAEKTAIKFAAGRGDVFFDDVGNMALSREAESGQAIEHVQVDAEPKGAAERVKSRLDIEPKQIPTSQILEGESQESFEPSDDELERIARDESEEGL